MDTGLHSLVAIARFHQLPAEPEQLAHQFAEPGKAFTDIQLLSAAKALTLKAKSITLDISKLKNDTLPAMIKTHDGAYMILARIAEHAADNQSGSTQTYLIHDLREASVSRRVCTTVVG